VNPDDVTTLVKHRLEQAYTALEDAKYLIHGKRSTQSIVNRSYYAMFYASLALLQRLGKIPSKHSGVISLFDTEFVLKGHFPKELSKAFHKAFQLRQAADYQVMAPIRWESAEEVYEHSVRFVDAVTAYLAEISGTESTESG
jgi:uncharacterized protein (UPF0332 family)